MRSSRRQAVHSRTKDGTQTPPSSTFKRKPSRHERSLDSSHALGNQALQHLRSGVLAGRGLSQPGDQREVQADRTAERVLSMPTTAADKPPSRRGAPSGGPGQPLPENVRNYFEPRFGTNLEHVRIRNDQQAALEAEALSARAFTYGNVISFAYGQYAPHSSDGLQLLAHELAHVTQDQNSNTVHRQFWAVDDSARKIHRNIFVNLNFTETQDDIDNGRAWTESRKDTFRAGFESSIEDTFNNNSFVIKPPQSYSDVLPQENIDQGYKPLVNIILPPGNLKWPSLVTDWEVSVAANPDQVFMRSTADTSIGNLDEDDNRPLHKEGAPEGVDQVATVHEFGHFLGLGHPGNGVEGASEYGHTGEDAHGNDVSGPTDLMGTGMELRAFYFEEWARELDRHVARLRIQRLINNINDLLRPWPMGDFPVPPPGSPRYG